MKNIYDLEGNVGEFTMQANSTTYRIRRGGAYNRANVNVLDSASHRIESNYYPNVTHIAHGSRSTLYIP